MSLTDYVSQTESMTSAKALEALNTSHQKAISNQLMTATLEQHQSVTRTQKIIG